MEQVKSSGHVIIVMAAIIIVLGALKIAAAIVVPLLLAAFIATIIAPLYSWLIHKKVPTILALFAVVGGLVIIVSLLGVLVGTSVQSFSENIPVYEDKLQIQLSSLTEMLTRHGLIKGDLISAFDPTRLMQYSATVLKGAGSVLTNSFMIFLIIIFILLESTHFSRKLEMADGERETMKHVNEVLTKIKRYMALKAVISLVTGIIVTIVLTMIGLDYAVLWGLVAFLFNFIPNIGSILAAVPAVLLALVQLGTFGAMEVGIVYFTINIIIGSIIEPRIMGQGLGMSTLVVFLSLIFWGWLLGPIGMLLSIPLTIMIKILLYTNENTRWLAVLMGNGEGVRESKNLNDA
ncbi:MAG: AI-2E family transporter [Helicobacteraceae bacterium]|jgi:AI-2 transport protein TqsA|nr:AI-2E family transporter [Helicobacteraceae bacterium]